MSFNKQNNSGCFPVFLAIIIGIVLVVALGGPIKFLEFLTQK